MTNRIRQYYQPVDLQTALVLLNRNLRAAIVSTPPKPPPDLYAGADVVIDLSRIDLAYVKEEGGVIRIGALTTLQALVESPVVQSLADGILSEAARLSAHLGLRNLATLDGAIGAAEGAAELRLALLALDASPVMQGELLEEIRLVNDPAIHGALARVARSPRDEAIVAVCAVILADGRRCKWARLTVGAPAPQRIESIEKMLMGSEFAAMSLASLAEAVMNEVKPAGDYRGSEEYRREMTGVLTKRVVMEAWRRAGN